MIAWFKNTIKKLCKTRKIVDDINSQNMFIWVIYRKNIKLKVVKKCYMPSRTCYYIQRYNNLRGIWCCFKSKISDLPDWLLVTHS